MTYIETVKRDLSRFFPESTSHKSTGHKSPDGYIQCTYVHRVITFKIRNFCCPFWALGIARGHIQYTVQYSISMLGRRSGGTSFVSLSLFVLLLYNTNFMNNLKLDVLKKLNTKNNSLTGHILFLAIDKITSFSTQKKGWST